MTAFLLTLCVQLLISWSQIELDSIHRFSDDLQSWPSWVLFINGEIKPEKKIQGYDKSRKKGSLGTCTAITKSSPNGQDPSIADLIKKKSIMIQ